MAVTEDLKVECSFYWETVSKEWLRSASAITKGHKKKQTQTTATLVNAPIALATIGTTGKTLKLNRSFLAAMNIWTQPRG